MTAAHSDRNLLFGLLALQMDFVTRDQLFAGMNAWILKKETPLGDLLVEQGVLLEEDRALLDSLVQRHVACHGSDPRESLRSLPSTVATASRMLSGLDDREVEASLQTVLQSAGDGEGDPHATLTYATPAPNGRYRVLRPLASGALGEVSVAFDEELKREVALKQIRPRHADSAEHRARFLLEAELTGHLEHPGTVPVHSLGDGGDGRPYYVMRLIHGETLDEAITAHHASQADGPDRAIAFRKLIRRFITVCETMEYAHSRGVLHRDLKPSNIMVGRFGETLVVDWGLAKRVGVPEGPAGGREHPDRPPASGGSSSETLPGSALGTPAFMSPEQAEGRVREMGPASDVYGLGATLFALLTGRPPFEGKDLGSILKQVSAGAFPRPRSLAPAAPRALESICLKAMSHDPEDRYASARALADDLERWLADEPVLADREPLAERAARWSRQHRPTVTAAAGLLVASVVLLSGATLFLQRAEARTLAQKRLAEQNFREARATILAFLTPLVQEHDPADLRPRLLTVARDRLDLFIRAHGDDPALRAELAATHLQLGSLMLHSAGLVVPPPAAPEVPAEPPAARPLLAPAPAEAADAGAEPPPPPAPPMMALGGPAVIPPPNTVQDAIAQYEAARRLYVDLARTSSQKSKYRERIAICDHCLTTLRAAEHPNTMTAPGPISGGRLTMFGD